jgi:hypothetical protein
VTMSCVLIALSVLKNDAYFPVSPEERCLLPCPVSRGCLRALPFWALGAVGAWSEVFLGTLLLCVLLCCACDSQLAPQGAGAVNVHGADLAMH